MTDNHYQVYLLTNQGTRRYIEISRDVQKRLDDHNNGISKWTAKYRPWKLAWMSKCLNLSDARKLENLMKRQKGGKGLNTLMELHQYSGS